MFHTGFRLDWTIVDALVLKVIAVNGWNNSVDNNTGKTFGLHLTLKPASALIVYLGYLVGPEGADTVLDASGALVGNYEANRRLRHLIDLVVNVSPTKALSLMLNADLGMEHLGPSPATQNQVYARWWGVNLTLKYRFVESFFGAVRGGSSATKMAS